MNKQMNNDHERIPQRRSKLSVGNMGVRMLRRRGFLRTARGLGPERPA